MELTCCVCTGGLLGHTKLQFLLESQCPRTELINDSVEIELNGVGLRNRVPLVMLSH